MISRMDKWVRLDGWSADLIRGESFDLNVVRLTRYSHVLCVVNGSIEINNVSLSHAERLFRVCTLLSAEGS